MAKFTHTLARVATLLALLFNGVLGRPAPDENVHATGRTLQQVATQPCTISPYNFGQVLCNDPSIYPDGCQGYWTGCYYSPALVKRLPNYVSYYYCGPSCDNTGYNPLDHTSNSNQCPTVACATSFSTIISSKPGCAQAQAFLNTTATGVLSVAFQSKDLVPALLQVLSPGAYCLVPSPSVYVQQVVGAWALTIANAYAKSMKAYQIYLCSAQCLGQPSTTINTCLSQGAACSAGVSGYASAFAQAIANNIVEAFSQMLLDPSCEPYTAGFSQANVLAGTIATQLEQSFIQQSALVLNGQSATCSASAIDTSASYAQAIACSIATAFTSIFTTVDPTTGAGNTTTMASACTSSLSFTFGGAGTTLAPQSTTCSAICDCGANYAFTPAGNDNQVCCPLTQVWDNTVQPYGSCVCPSGTTFNATAWQCQ